MKSKQDWITSLDDKVFMVVDASAWDVVNWLLVEKLGMSFYCEPQYSIDKTYYVYVSNGILRLQDVPPVVSERIINGPALSKLIDEYKGVVKKSDLEIRVELEALITEREGMMAENSDSLNSHSYCAYDEGAFIELAERMRALMENDDE